MRVHGIGDRTRPVVLLLAACLAWPAMGPAAALAASPSPSAPVATPEGSAAPSPVAAPSASADAWQPVVLPPEPVTVRLEADGDGVHGIPTDAAFTLWRDDGPANEVLPYLELDPPVDLIEEDTLPDGGLRLRPSQPLVADTEYRVRLGSADGRLLRSWVFITRGPLRVVSTLPRRWAEEVPLRSGIEFTFDQPDFSGFEDYFSIEPATPGRFEVHERVLSFVPREPLRPAQEYRVTLRAGLPVSGTGQALAEDVVLEFTTTGKARQRPRPLGEFARGVTEAGTRDAALIPLYVHRARTTTATVEVYRLPSLEAAADAVGVLQRRDDDDFDQPAPAIDTSGLEPVLSFVADMRRSSEWDGSERYFELPEPLPAGWYVVVVPDPAGALQMLLQVSDLAVYAQMSWTRSVVWVNDLVSRGPVEGASISLFGDAELGTTGPDGLLGTTGPDGLLVVDTPAAIVPGSARTLLLVRQGERAVLVPFGTAGWESGDIDRSWDNGPAADAWWSLLFSDRHTYRTSDSVHLWGLVRGRDGQGVPEEVTLGLVREEDDEDELEALPPILSITVRPTALGTFVATLPLADMPIGWYDVRLRYGDLDLDTVGIRVAPIVKPAYQLALSTPRRVYIVGEEVELTANAAFFDGTAVPAVPLQLVGLRRAVSRTTDARGTARSSFRVSPMGQSDQQWDFRDLSARPSRGEEASIGASTDILVFASSVVLDAKAELDGDVARLRGSLSRLDRDRLERQYDRAFELAFDPRGDPVPAAAVSARIIRETSVRRQVGTRYDFVAKKVVPVWEYDTLTRLIGRRDVLTDEKGGFSFTFPVAEGHGYRVVLSAADASGRTTRMQTWAQRRTGWVSHFGAYLTAAGAEHDMFWPHASFGAGEEVAVEMRDSEGILPVGGANRYLFLTAQRGIRSAAVQSRPVLRFDFRATDAPLLEVSGIRFTGDGYVAVPDGFAADFDPASRDLTVELAPGAPRYAPGERADVEVLVRDAGGRPVVADVVVRGIDEKLYAIGAASSYDPLEELYRSVPSGTTRTYASHQVPGLGPRGEGGDAGAGGDGGDGGRRIFRDEILFELLTTGTDGRAQVAFELPDDLTSWRISATALTGELQAGEGSTLVAVGLPFFVELVTAAQYLEGDQAAVLVRAYGAGLERADSVELLVSAPSLGMTPLELTAGAFSEVSVPLPALTAGEHAITVRGSLERDGESLSDTLTRTIRVVPTRLSRARTVWLPLEDAASPPGGEGFTDYLVTDAGRGAALPVLLELASQRGARAEQVLAATEARRILIERFGFEPASLPTGTFRATQFQAPSGGIAILPYASPDPELSVLVALLAPDAVEREELRGYIAAQASALDRGRPLPRETRAMILAGRAGLGERVAGEVRLLATQGSGNTRELLYLALAAATVGDEATAMSIERQLIERLGQAQGPYLRLVPPGGVSPDRDGTALLSILAATLGDLDTADATDRYLAVDPPSESLVTLHRLATAVRRMERAPAELARFAVTIDGQRTQIALEEGSSWSASLVPAQRAGLAFEVLEGSPMLAATWQEALDPRAVGDDPAISVARRVRPAGPLEADRVVSVRIEVGLDATALPGCYFVTDNAPSGLAPLSSYRWWRGGERGDALEPWSVVGQRVTFCVERSAKRPLQKLRYRARVVTPGTYLWEPTLVQSADAPDQQELGEASSIEVR